MTPTPIVDSLPVVHAYTITLDVGPAVCLLVFAFAAYMLFFGGRD